MSGGDTVTGLARQVQHHVPEQPWGRYGTSPAPLEIWYHHDPDSGRPDEWRVRFVTAVKGGKRSWGQASGPTIEAALTAARQVQQATSAERRPR